MNNSIRRIGFISLVFVVTFLFDIIIEDRYLRDALTFGAFLLIFNIFILLESKNDLISFLFPSSIAINYIYSSLFIGAVGFYQDAIVIGYMKLDAPFWSDSVVPNVFIAGVLSFVVLFSRYRQVISFVPIVKRQPNVLFILYALFLLLLYLYIGTKFIFGGQLLGAIIIIYILYTYSFKSALIRTLLYSLILSPFALSVADSKREIVFLFYSIIVAEVIRGGWRGLRIRHFIYVGFGIFSLSFLILVLSVLRNPLAFDIRSMTDIPGAVIYYTSLDNFSSHFLLNIEATYTYFHVINAIDMSIKEEIPLLLGETYIKPLFIWLPRTWLDWKPRSAIDHYTTVFDPAFRLAGGSWVISALGEAFLNFRLAGAAVLGVILGFLDKAFRDNVLSPRSRSLVYAVGCFYFGVAILTFMRGSGLDLALILWIVVVVCAVPLSLILNYSDNLQYIYVRESDRRTGKVTRRLLDLPRSMRDISLSSAARPSRQV